MLDNSTNIHEIVILHNILLLWNASDVESDSGSSYAAVKNPCSGAVFFDGYSFCQPGVTDKVQVTEYLEFPR